MQRVEVLSSSSDDEAPVAPAARAAAPVAAAAPTATVHVPAKAVGPPKPPAGLVLKRRGKVMRCVGSGRAFDNLCLSRTRPCVPVGAFAPCALGKDGI